MRLQIAVALALIACLKVTAQNALASLPKFGPEWRILAGQWTAESSAGAGPSSCAFRFELGDHILVRTNHAETLPGGPRPAGTHYDLMVIYPGAVSSQGHATYWDNEGHVIEYSATWSADGNTLTFLSKPAPGPQFRLTYKKLDPEALNVSFDMAPPGQAGNFKTYTSGRIRHGK